jgi:hypothetical protein
MQLNNIRVIDRHQRPNVLNKVLLRSFFINDGAMQDPYQVSSVNVFAIPAGTSPSSVLDGDLISDNSAGDAKMCFQPSSDAIVRDQKGITEQFDVEEYTGALAPYPGVLDEYGYDGWVDSQPCSGVSGVYRLDEGEFGVVLDGILGGALSSVSQVDNATVDGIWGNMKNTASAATTYIDVWTVKLTANSPWTTIINSFELFTDTFYTITEPPLLSTQHKLMNTNVVLGSIVQLKVGVDITLQNRSIDSSIKNLFKNAAIIDPKFKVMKVDQQAASYPSRVTVLDWEWIQDVDVTSDNTLILNFDTVYTLDTTAPSDLATPVGTYALQVEYKILRETIRSPLMFFTVS